MVENTSLAIVGDNPVPADYGDDAGGGFENTTSADFKASFLRILQSNSPQIESVEGAKAGLIINTVTNALFESVMIIPAITEHLYVEWLPRKQGGGAGQGFIGVHALNDPMVQDALKKLPNKFARGEDGKVILPKSPAGNDLVETVYFHGVQFNPENESILPAIIAFSSTGLPVSSAWLTTARQEIAKGTGKSKPLFAHVYKLGSNKTTRNGNTWYNWTVAFAGGSASKSLLAVDSDAFAAARMVRDSVKAGTAKVDYAASAPESHDGGGSTGGAKAGSDEIPF